MAINKALIATDFSHRVVEPQTVAINKELIATEFRLWQLIRH